MTTIQLEQNNDAKMPGRIVFFIDNVKFETTDCTMTVRAILTSFAKEDPAQTTLTLINGNERTKYEDADFLVVLKNGMKFAVLHNGPTTVS